MGRFTTGITVITLFDAEQQRLGITINSFTSVSLDPPLILFCLDKKAQIFPIFSACKAFAVNILAADQGDVSQHFADYRHHPQPSDLWAGTEGHAPLLAGTLGSITCRKFAEYPGGDHIIFVGEVFDLQHSDAKKDPLVYFRSAYRRLG